VLLVAIVLFALSNLHRWPTVQFILNLATVSLIAIGVVSYLFFEREFISDFEHIIAFVYLIIDTISLAILLAIVISALPQQNDSGHWLSFVALIQFYAADYLYIIQILNDQYVPNGLADWLYLASLLLLANSLRTSYQHVAFGKPDAAAFSLSNAQSISLVILILSLPIVALVIQGIRSIELLYFSAILIILLLPAWETRQDCRWKNCWQNGPSTTTACRSASWSEPVSFRIIMMSSATLCVMIP